MQSEIYSYLKRNKVINPQVLVSVTEQAVEDKYWNDENSAFNVRKKIVVPSTLPEGGVDSDGIYWYQMPDGGFSFCFETDKDGNELKIENELLFFGQIGQMTTGAIAHAFVMPEKVELSSLINRGVVPLGGKSHLGTNGELRAVTSFTTFLNKSTDKGMTTLYPEDYSRFPQLYHFYDGTAPRKVITCVLNKGNNYTSAGFCPGSTFYFYMR